MHLRMHANFYHCIKQNLTNLKMSMDYKQKNTRKLNSAENIIYHVIINNITNFNDFHNNEIIIHHLANFKDIQFKNYTYYIKKNIISLVQEYNVITYMKLLHGREILKLKNLWY